LHIPFDDIAFLHSHIYIRQEDAVKRWTQVACDDYQLPLSLLIGFLSDAIPPISLPHIAVRERAEYQALVDIVQKSRLNEILVLDGPQRVVTYRREVPEADRRAIAEFIQVRSVTIAN
jgi:hypothetical protein